MSLLKEFEHKLESMLEGFFAKSFRSGIHPLEIAKKLARNMGENKVESVSRVYVPNTYVILLSRRDEERISSFEQSLKTELADFLEKHAAEEGYTIVGTPEITILTRRNLSFGEIKIESELVTPKAVADLDEQARAEQPVRGTLTVVNGAGACFEVAGGTTTIGRLETNDVVLEDPLASRVHAEIRQEKGSFAIVDLGSTNGTLVQGERVTETALADRDIVTIGETRLEFRRE